MERYQRLWMNQLLGNRSLFAEKPKAAGEPPKFKAGDCVEGNCGCMGWVIQARPSEARVRKARVCGKGTLGETGTFRNSWLKQYLVPGDKVELLPCARYAGNIAAGTQRTVGRRSIVFTVPDDPEPLLRLDRSDIPWQWPLSCVRKIEKEDAMRGPR